MACSVAPRAPRKDGAARSTGDLGCTGTVRRGAACSHRPSRGEDVGDQRGHACQCGTDEAVPLALARASVASSKVRTPVAAAVGTRSASGAPWSSMPVEMGQPNFPEFRDHRHDQSLLSLVAMRMGIVAYRDPSQYGEPQHCPVAHSPQMDSSSYGTLFLHDRNKS